MKLFEIGEFGLISLIRDIVAGLQNWEHISWQKTVLGIGDDAAAWQSDEHIELATTDTLVQNIHFDLGLTSWNELGWKALAVNLSDIAAMGGIPRYALLSLSLPAELAVEDISKFVDGMVSLAGEFGVAIVGGNVAAAPNVVITVTVIGYSVGKTILKRSTACPHEQVAVTGYLGSSAAGLEMLKGKTVIEPEIGAMLRRAHLKPLPRVKEGQILVEQGVKTAIDISDGLVADLAHICESSKVNARIRIEQLPVHPVVAAKFPNHSELALYGGEDYELLFVADEATVERAKQSLDCPVTVIGDITDERLPTQVTVVDSKGNTIACSKKGWEHFRSIPERLATLRGA
ncbi:MAG: thiamine-phosphate kinase [Dehalococcoidia bacterium]